MDGVLDRRYRFLFVFGCLCFSVFFGAPVVAMLHGGPAGSIGNKVAEVAVVLLSLGFALGFFMVGVRMLFAQPMARKLPAEALEHCLVCGELTPSNVTCPCCGEPPCERETVFSVERDGNLAGILWFLVSGGIAGLGAGITIGPYFEGERRIWTLAMFAALGLLLLVVGSFGVVAAVAAVFNWLRGRAHLSFCVDRVGVRGSGDGLAQRGRVLSLQGTARVVGRPAASLAAPGGYRVSFGDLPFAEMMATFDAAGIVTIEPSTSYEWRLTPSFHRTETREAIVSLVQEFRGGRYIEPEENDLAFSVHRFVSSWINGSTSLAELYEKLSADRAHRAQAELHAQSLRERGIPLSGALVDAVLVMLRK
ncbi:hypothetical protein LZC95_32190 [Pendulispora brunnea]|uniref:Uncharacterized protein n=1 Tax=Pendulispora brunnea TaxID=2905690 RepID=A0ABZ2K1P1_9BACT